MTQENHTVCVEEAQGESEDESHELTLEEESFLECLSSIVLRQLHAESSAEDKTLSYDKEKAA